MKHNIAVSKNTRDTLKALAESEGSTYETTLIWALKLYATSEKHASRVLSDTREIAPGVTLEADGSLVGTGEALDRYRAEKQPNPRKSPPMPANWKDSIKP